MSECVCVCVCVCLCAFVALLEGDDGVSAGLILYKTEDNFLSAPKSQHFLSVCLSFFFFSDCVHQSVAWVEWCPHWLTPADRYFGKIWRIFCCVFPWVFFFFFFFFFCFGLFAVWDAWRDFFFWWVVCTSERRFMNWIQIGGKKKKIDTFCYVLRYVFSYDKSLWATVVLWEVS